jgi:hypothetical protein
MAETEESDEIAAWRMADGGTYLPGGWRNLAEPTYLSTYLAEPSGHTHGPVTWTLSLSLSLSLSVCVSKKKIVSKKSKVIL